MSRLQFNIVVLLLCAIAFLIALLERRSSDEKRAFMRDCIEDHQPMYRCQAMWRGGRQ